VSSLVFYPVVHHDLFVELHTELQAFIISFCFILPKKKKRKNQIEQLSSDELFLPLDLYLNLPDKNCIL
jgi:hypothetical protein